jgi:hypothetical protein
MFGLLTRRRRARIAARPFPEPWLEILERDVPLYTRLEALDRLELQRHVQVFLSEKRFEGCGGVVLTEEMTVTIASQACLLLLHRDTDYYPTVRSILVYPATYVAPVVEETDDWLVTEGHEDREGEAWEHGVVVLSWADVQADTADATSGRNLVLHEFAHQLDMEDGSPDGAPLLPRRTMYAEWQRVMSDAYARLKRDVTRRRPTEIDEYGATDPAEFFAVVTEGFFERPAELREAEPALYEQLAAYYGQDPVARPSGR